MSLVQHLAPEQVAARLSISIDTVYRMCQDGRLPSKRIGRRRIISEADVVELLEQDVPDNVVELRRAR